VPAGWVSAGAAVLGVGENIMSNNSAKDANSANNANNAQLSNAQNTMLSDAETVANQPFQAYTGQMVAPMTGNQQQAYSLASQDASAGVPQQDNAKATGLLDQVANNSFSQNNIDNYMNPYTQSVTDAATAAQNVTYNQAVAANAAKSGQTDAFGGGRADITNASLASQNALAVGSLTATNNANAYNQAVSAWQNDNSTKLNAANAYNASGQDLTNMNSADISNLMQTGGTSYAINQSNLAAAYSQFQEQQGWSAQQLGSLISAVGSDKGSPAQTAAVQSNIGNQLLGLGSTIAGLAGGGRTSLTNSGAPTNAQVSATTAGAANLSASDDLSAPPPIAIEGGDDASAGDGIP
jgi:hypothetical protein